MKTGKRILAFLMTMLMVLSCWVWFEPVETSSAANLKGDSNYLFAYFTGTSIEGQTIHLAVSQDGLNYTALRNNEPVIVPSKGTGCVRDPYLWYNEQDNYYYILATDLDFTDTGSDYSDNSESFIVWRSKDLVHWYDETMIDVKAILGKLGINNNNMQAVWAPQVLWDGSSYVVYFSLQCDATSNGSWNPLTIVYLKTTDLLDQSKYNEYGVIHNPGRHVIDADIIKNPTTGQYYMFYKDEADSIQAIYYMISDSSPVGPYYAPDNANSGRGPKVFPSLNVNIEGCNSFFDDNGNLITYVDEYGYKNASGQVEAHFHVSSTSDFKTYNKLAENSYNINSLSPRHGSVVKITDEEYNRLLNNAYGITSSSFPATEELSDHLVGRYFTTSDYTYNAANGKKDLKLTDGTISMGKEASGEYYANFQSAGAEVDLNALIPGDLNIKDGFTITFTALIPSSTTGANTRFFDISNNWSQRSDPNEVYLHMSPIAENNGLYVGAFNGPVTTGSWPWMSQGKNYNDDTKHEYIISFADGNMIMYIDGELAMKRDRFNFNTEYGDNFIDDNWFKQIGNSKMRIGKSEWSDPLLTGYLQDFCIYDCSMSYYDVKTIQNEQDIEAGLNNSNVSSYNGMAGVAPKFEQDDPAMGTAYYSNILYSPVVNGPLPYNEGEDNANPDSNRNKGQAAVSNQTSYTNVGIYYSKETVMFVDGINTPKMPVMIAARLNKNNYDDQMETAYPTASASSTADNSYFYLTQNWYGWTRTPNFTYAISNPDGSSQRIGHNSSTRLSADLDDANTQGNRSVYYYASVLALNTNNVTFNSDGYQKYTLSWLWDSKKTSGTNEAAPNNNIWVVDLRSYVTARNEIANNYDAIVKNKNYCPATIEAYKSIVEVLMEFNPQSYNYAGGVETAVKACSTQAQKLVADYNKVKAQLGACKKIDIVGTSATCTAPGMTAGSYCEYCGTFYEEQKITSEALGHHFVEVDKTKVQCTRCGEICYNAPMEIRYENLFSFNAWAKSQSSNTGYSNSSVSTNMIDGTITIVNGEASGEVYNNASYTPRNTSFYATPVEGGKTYVYEFTATGDYAGEVFIFKYDANGNLTGGYGDTNVSGTGTVSKEFTVESNTAWVEFRFDANAKGTITYSDIGIYTKESFENFARYTKEARIAYYSGENKDLCAPTGKLGYKFGGWFASGKEITETMNLPTSTSTVVYAQWTKQVNVTFDNLIDIYQWGTAAGGGTISDIEENGFTLTSNNGVGEATSTSPLFPVTAGKKYLVDIDITGENWDVYIFFYDNNTSSGLGIDFEDSKNRFSEKSGSNFDRHGSAIFTAPAGATRAVIRVDANGSNNAVRFEDIRVSEATEVFVPTANKLVAQGSAYGTLPIPERDGYEFIGWFNGNTYVTEESIMNTEKTVNLTSKWVVSSVVADFDSPVEINPFDGNESLFTIKSVTPSTGDFGKFTTSNNKITYTPDKVLNSVDIATYTISFSNVTKTFDLLVLPASSVLYNEDKLTVSNTKGNAWSTEGTANTAKQTQSGKNDVYGYDANYKNETGFSYGTAYKASVDSTNTRSQTLSFSYQGNAVDLYASCGENTGIYIVTIRDINNNKIEKVYITDTYFSDSDFYGNEGKINQVPIIHHENSGFGSYSVEVTSAYLASVVSQRRTFSMRDNDEMNFYTADIAEEAKEAILMFAEMEDLLGEDIEVTFCDENSVFNGGSGVPVKSDFGAFALTSQADNGEEYTSLDNYFDGFRVYNAADYDGMYLESEQGAAYYNVVENLLSEDDIITSENDLKGIAYLEQVADEDYNLGTYVQNGPKNELYLNPGASITLTVKSTNPDAKAMVSLRTVNGNQTSVAIANGAVNGTEIVKDTYTITNTTDMYYRINNVEVDENAESFIITIQNTGDAYLVIGTLRLCNGLSLAPMMMSAMPRVRMMMAAPATETEPNAPVEEEILPSEPEVDVPETDIPDTDVSDTENSDADSSKSFFNNIKDFINKIIEFFTKIIDKLKAFIA